MKSLNWILQKAAITFAAASMIAWMLAFIVYGVGPLLEQALEWLELGYTTPRDLFWVTAETRCAATGWEHMGTEGKKLCRVDYIQFTDMVGANRLLNWGLGIHVGVWFLVATLLFAILYATVMGIIFSWIEKLEKYKPTKEEWPVVDLERSDD